MAKVHDKTVATWGRFCRHAGLISLETQKRIRSATLAIVGVGGIGGAFAMMCAKLGFGRIALCDREQYELVNIVEQIFATQDTVGKDKSDAAARELVRHNPDCKISALQKEISCQEDAIAVIEGADYVVSGVDNPFPRIYLSRAARRSRIPLIIPANIGWSIFCNVHTPEGGFYESRLLSLPGIKVRDGELDLGDSYTCEIIQVDWDIWVVLMADYRGTINEAILRGDIRSYPYLAAPAFFAASLGVTQLVSLIEEGKSNCNYPANFCFNTRLCKILNWAVLLRRHGLLLDSFIQSGREGLVESWKSSAHNG